MELLHHWQLKRKTSSNILKSIVIGLFRMTTIKSKEFVPIGAGSAASEIQKTN
jgi:hypothetical protein